MLRDSDYRFRDRNESKSEWVVLQRNERPRKWFPDMYDWTFHMTVVLNQTTNCEWIKFLIVQINSEEIQNQSFYLILILSQFLIDFMIFPFESSDFSLDIGWHSSGFLLFQFCDRIRQLLVFFRCVCTHWLESFLFLLYLSLENAKEGKVEVNKSWTGLGNRGLCSWILSFHNLHEIDWASSTNTWRVVSRF